MTLQIAMDARPGGPAAKTVQPSPAGLEINPGNDLSAVGAALKLGPLSPVSLGAQPRDLQFHSIRNEGHLQNKKRRDTCQVSRPHLC